jgi:uroporphyrinogen decarboxylase
MIDLAEQPPEAMLLLDRIMAFEKDLMTLAAENEFDAFYFGDDWGTQQDLMISLAMWKNIFKARYKDQFDHAKSLGLYTVFHSCGNVTKIIPELHEIGLDVMYISQPRVVDLDKISSMLRGAQCFMSLIDYQRVSITGTPPEIMKEGRRLMQLLATNHGGFIGYIEDYSCMGMSRENYGACKMAFSG